MVNIVQARSLCCIFVILNLQVLYTYPSMCM